ncbi:hypothetical protein B0H10DRAFT_2447623 [Mycena sp. CBHHK59/15]|nr:hypothetical protein B0H10DRAFT_2447623 [Mycena sp. CBHHK59/15]
MAPFSTFPPGFQIVELSGALMLTFLADWGLFGALTVQLYLYYQAFPNDRWFTKCLVYTVYSIQVVQIVMTTIDAFRIFGYGFRDVSALTKVNFSWFSVPVIIGLVSFIVQSFYAFRIYVLSRSRIIPVLIVGASLAISVNAFITGRFTLEAGDVTILNNLRDSTPLGVYLSGAALIDITIAVCMIYYLTINDTGFRQTHAIISKLVRLTIETNSLTASVALTTLILYFVFPGKVYYAAPANLMPMLYANTMSAVLNSRFHILGGRAPHISSTVILGNSDNMRNTGTTSGPIVFNREISTEGEMGGQVEMNDVRPATFARSWRHA